jgi:hypothetical protein
MPAALITPGMAGFVSDINRPDLAVAANFERFDGLGPPPLASGPNPVGGQAGLPLDAPAASDPSNGGTGFGADFGFNEPGHYPRPGQINQPLGQVYTQGPLQGVVGTLGGQPLPVSDRIHRPEGDYTKAKAPTIQWRLGVGQKGPSELGLAQTVTQSEFTNNPPVPGELTGILAGLG